MSAKSGRSRISVVSGASSSSNDKGLADDLQEAGQALESQNSSNSNSSSVGSEPRDSLREAEAVERRLELSQKDKEPSSPSSSPRQTRRRTRDQFAARASEGQRPILGLSTWMPTSKGSSSDPDSSSDANNPSASCSGSAASDSMHVQADKTELLDKVKQLKQALDTRDEQQADLMQKMVNMESINKSATDKFGKQLKEMRKAKKAAEDSKNRAAVAQAGERARHTSQLQYEKREAAEYKEMHAQRESKDDENKSELEQARAEVETQAALAKVQDTHHRDVWAASDSRIASLEKMLSDATRELAANQGQDASTASSSNADDRGASDRKEQTRLRDELQLMMEARATDRNEMSKLRLEMLGLKRESAKQAIVSNAESMLGREQRQGKGSGKGQHLLGRGSARGRGRSTSRTQLTSIDEDENDDLPSLDEEDIWASECVSSDAGDSADGQSIPDKVAQSDHLQILHTELKSERLSTQKLEDDLASLRAEQMEQLEHLRKQLEDSSEMQEDTAAEVDRLRTENSEEVIKNVERLDAIQLMLREKEDLLGDQKVQIKEQLRDKEQNQLDTEELQTRLNLSTEALRIAGMRLADSQQQQAQETVRQKREISNMKLELAVERHRLRGTLCQLQQPEEEGGEEETEQRPESHLQELVNELQEERNVLLSKLEAKEVQFQIQVEELEMQSAAQINEITRKFQSQMDDLHEKYRAMMFKSHDHEPSMSSEEAVQGSSGVDMEACPTDSSSTPASSSLVNVERQPSHSSASSKKGTLYPGLKRMLWDVLSLVPNVAAILCNLEDLIIQKVSQRAATLLGPDLHGKSLLSLIPEECFSSKLRRAVFVNQSLADSAHAEIPGFLGLKVGNYTLESNQGRTVDAHLSVAHVPSDPSAGEEKGLVVIFSEPHMGTLQPSRARSSASSDICPSDSVSVSRRRPQPMAAETQRQLRASFFAARLSAPSTPAPSSPRGSCAT